MLHIWRYGDRTQWALLESCIIQQLGKYTHTHTNQNKYSIQVLLATRQGLNVAGKPSVLSGGIRLVQPAVSGGGGTTTTGNLITIGGKQVLLTSKPFAQQGQVQQVSCPLLWGESGRCWFAVSCCYWRCVSLIYVDFVHFLFGFDISEAARLFVVSEYISTQENKRPSHLHLAVLAWNIPTAPTSISCSHPWVCVMFL